MPVVHLIFIPSRGEVLSKQSNSHQMSLVVHRKDTKLSWSYFSASISSYSSSLMAGLPRSCSSSSSLLTWILSMNNLINTYSFQWHPHRNTGNSQICMCFSEISSEIQIRMCNCLLNNFIWECNSNTSSPINIRPKSKIFLPSQPLLQSFLPQMVVPPSTKSPISATLSLTSSQKQQYMTDTVLNIFDTLTFF